MKTITRRVVIAATAVATLTPVAAVGAPTAGPYHYAQVTVSRSGATCTNTKAIAINDAGTYVGEVYCGLARGYIRTGSTTTLVKVPRRAHGDTQLTAVSSNGIVSLYTERVYNPPDISYLRSPSGKLTRLRDPKAGRLGAQVLSVNDKGSAVGVYYPGKTVASARSFRYSHGTFKTFTLKVKGASGVTLDTINDAGTVGGFYTDKHGVTRSFLLRHGKVSKLAEPRASHKKGTGFGISELANNGTYVSVEFLPSTKVVSYVHRRGAYSRISVPSSFGVSTGAFGVNSSGEIVGDFLNLNLYRGFTATLTP